MRIRLCILLAVAAIGCKQRPTQTTQVAGNVTEDKSLLWPKGIIPFYFEKGFPEKSKAEVIKAMRQWSCVTPIQFIEKDDMLNKYELKLKIFTGQLPVYAAGRATVGIGKESDDSEAILPIPLEEKDLESRRFPSLSINPKVADYGTMLHELGHVIGLLHEHQRIDRDKFITVTNENLIKTGKGHVSSKMGIPSGNYDFDSIMHYGRHLLSNGRGPVLTPTNRENVVGQRMYISRGDAQTVVALYSDTFTDREFERFKKTQESPHCTNTGGTEIESAMLVKDFQSRALGEIVMEWLKIGQTQPLSLFPTEQRRIDERGVEKDLYFIPIDKDSKTNLHPAPFGVNLRSSIPKDFLWMESSLRKNYIGSYNSCRYAYGLRYALRMTNPDPKWANLKTRASLQAHFFEILLPSWEAWTVLNEDSEQILKSISREFIRSSEDVTRYGHQDYSRAFLKALERLFSSSDPAAVSGVAMKIANTSDGADNFLLIDDRTNELVILYNGCK